MPNYCESDLYVEGMYPDLKEFADFIGDGFDFNKFIPYPAEFAELDKRSGNWAGFNSGGYEWCLENWGTKWNASQVIVTPPSGEWEDSIYETEMEVQFHTAWSPPKPVILAASRKFPKVTFDVRYFERGMAFNGVYECKAGEVVRDQDGKYFGKRGG